MIIYADKKKLVNPDPPKWKNATFKLNFKDTTSGMDKIHTIKS